ncbi:MAG: DDE-type integrase/transposase/recombinase [Nitrosopumilaceae archaeon]|nr:DDE-type integrase/transposase/recombinase [Nitrosopumilaceae archaeon]
MADVRGKEWWLVALMDLSTRFVLAWDVLTTKEGYDAAPLLRKARDVAGRVPRVFITDGLDQHHIAFKKVFRTIKASGQSTSATSTSGTAYATSTNRSGSMARWRTTSGTPTA